MVTTINLPTFLATNPQPFTGPALLDQKRYILRGYWSPGLGWGQGGWCLDLRDGANVPLVLGLPLVVTGADGDLLTGYHDDTRVPTGRLRLVRLIGTGDPGRFDLGSGSVRLEYVTASEDT